jgi:hypothetical protein
VDSGTRIAEILTVFEKVASVAASSSLADVLIDSGGNTFRHFSSAVAIFESVIQAWGILKKRLSIKSRAFREGD